MVHGENILAPYFDSGRKICCMQNVFAYFVADYDGCVCKAYKVQSSEAVSLVESTDNRSVDLNASTSLQRPLTAPNHCVQVQ